MRYAALLSVAVLFAGCANAHDVTAGANAGLPAIAERAGTVITVGTKGAGPKVSADIYGANMGTWYNFRQAWIAPSIRAAGMHVLRFPGGSESDAYHWENGGSLCDGQGYITAGDTFDNFMKTVVAPDSLDVSITLNYGSNRTCNGGGDPTEAGAWAAYAKKRGYHVTYWTVGNEIYGSWEYDLHAQRHDPHEYSSAVKTGYYPDVKAGDSNAKLGVVVDTPNDAAWNTVVLREAKPFDFVELHYYPEYTSSGTNSNDSDAFLLGKALDNFAKDLTGLRKQMTAAGVAASTPIYLGEYNADAGAEGTQSLSIVNGLFLGQTIAEAVAAGLPRATWWIAYGACDTNGDFSKKLYGWQRTFGSEALFSDSLPEYGCYNTPRIPGGTPFPTARVMSLYAASVPGGSIARPTTVTNGNGIRAYGYSTGGGYTVVAFNNVLASAQVTIQLNAASRSSFAATETVYGKTQYDRSKNNQWVGPTTTNLGTTGPRLALMLDPYSMTVVTLK